MTEQNLPAKSTSDGDDKRTFQVFQVARFRLLLWITIIALSLGLLSNLVFFTRLEPILVISTAIVVLGFAFYLLERNNLRLAVALLLWTMLVAITYLIYSGDGLRDSAILALPALLIYSAMLSPDRQFKLMFLLEVMAVIAIGLSEYVGWKDYGYGTEYINLGDIFDVSLILVVIGSSIWLVSSDLNKAFSQLDVEINRVKASQNLIQLINNFDQLTGLPNRNLSKDRFEQSLARSVRNQNELALIYLDLDNFKQVSDTLGHDIGDALLQQLAARLKDVVREQDTVSRQGGDEFLVILESVHGEEAVSHKVIDVQKAIQQPYEIQGKHVETSASIGIALAPSDGSEFDTVRNHAETAMYQAKGDGRNTFRFFNPQMQQHNQEHFQLLRDLREATRQLAFELYFQPKVLIADNSILGAEALIRWHHPQRGIVSPVEFIPLAENYGLIEPIGDWVIQQACKACASWHEQGYGSIRVAVNLSFIQFRSFNLASTIRESLQSAGLAAEFLELELTESVLHEDSFRVPEQIHEINQLGSLFSIDDFGTGYSNLGKLGELDISELKIDRSFIQELSDSKRAKSLAKGIIKLADSLKLAVVAEGIEDAKTRDKLKKLGCQVGQGFYWSPPVTAAEFQRLLATGFAES